MTALEKLETIRSRFAEAPQTVARQQLEAQIAESAAAHRKLLDKLSEAQMLENSAHDRIANQLDKDIPGWRQLVQRDWVDHPPSPEEDDEPFF